MTLRHATVGQLCRHPCLIQRLFKKARDEDEDSQDEWVTCGKTRASFPQQVGAIYSNREVIENFRQVGRNIQYMEIRYPGFDVTSEMRLYVRGKYYNIRGVENIEGKNRRLSLVVVPEVV